MRRLKKVNKFRNDEHIGGEQSNTDVTNEPRARRPDNNQPIKLHPRRALQIAKWERHRLARVNELERRFSSQGSTRINKDQGLPRGWDRRRARRDAANGSQPPPRCPPSFVFSSTFHQPREWFSIKGFGLAEEAEGRDGSGRGRGNGDAERARREQVVNYGHRLYKSSQRPSSRLNRSLK